MQPLKNIRILDFTRLLPGAYCTLVLSDLGAEVIKIESSEKGDYMRFIPPFLKDGTSAAFAMVNRSKKSVSLDFRNPKDIEKIKKLVSQSDVIVEGFRPGVMKAMGLHYHSLRKIKKNLIYCSLSGYGQEGKLSHLAAHDLNFLCLAGVFTPLSLSLRAERSEAWQSIPQLLPTQLADLCGGSLQAALASVGAIFARSATGKGKYLDISILEG
ncbi:MAG: CoA transferase, partial [Deltaproteobacteria bacterium]|nr:CoA transferase [Deltaproteobacteria bacterium]